MRSWQEQQQRQEDEERLFSELWAGDRQAKEEQESARVQTRQQRNQEQRDFLRKQMEAAEQQRKQQRELRQEEAQLLVCPCLYPPSDHHSSLTYTKKMISCLKCDLKDPSADLILK